MEMDGLLKKVLKYGVGERFISFVNADGKRWWMPTRNMRVAMNLYQPSGRKGKLVKCGLPWLYGMPMVLRVLHAERLRLSLQDELCKLLGGMFACKELEFSVFGGTPSVHQKLTMQLSKGTRILGYCKATESEEVARLFRSEAKVLEALNGAGIIGIPQCLFCGEMRNGVKLFVQTTVKTRKSEVVHEWNRLHDDFLERLYQRTHRTVLFEESDYYQTLTDWRKHIDWLPDNVNKAQILSVIDHILLKYQGKRMDFSAYHADFTPWNMFVEKGELFVFDWEYARLTYPPHLDRYHFFTQTAIFEKHWTAAEIHADCLSRQADWMDKEAYVLYLLDVMARFTLREKGQMEGDIARSMKIWNDILVFLTQ